METIDKAIEHESLHLDRCGSTSISGGGLQDNFRHTKESNDDLNFEIHESKSEKGEFSQKLVVSKSTASHEKKMQLIKRHQRP